MNGFLVFSLLLFIASDYVAGTDANIAGNKTDVLDGNYLYGLGTKYNNPLLRLIGKAFLRSENQRGDLQHNISVRLCELHPCTEWGSWSKCPVNFKGQFAMVIRSRNCNKTDTCPNTRPTNLITTESKVCEGSIECPKSYESIDDLFCFKFNSSAKSQPDAKTACHSDGGYIVHVVTKIKSDAVHALLSRHGFSSTIWVNGERTSSVGPWAFEYGSDPDFDNWMNSEPSNGSNELCKADVLSSGQRVWYDRTCTKSFAFVCELV